MKTKIKKPAKVNIVTLGCAKNTVDSEVLLTQLTGNGIHAVHDAEKEPADIVVINTCGFIEEAKQESIDTILKYAAAKQNGFIEKIYVTGCLSERYRAHLEKEIPDVDAWFGTRELSRLLKQLRANYKHELVGERILSNPSHFAYLKISEGCNRPCSFCAIPLMRGRHVSKPLEQVVLEAENLAKNGAKELLLIAQDSTYYGIDLYGKRKLADLLIKLSEIKQIEWIRLHYAFPTGFPVDVLDVMAERDTICNYLDMPLQHGSSNMLRIMKRGTTHEKTVQLINNIRKKVPNVAIRTTLMVGHPGETDADFEHMTRFVEQTRFERLGVFTYSHEENTTAYTLPDDIPAEVKQERMNVLMSLQEKISLELNQNKIGHVFKTLIDRKEGDQFIGRTEFDSPEVDNEVIIDAPSSALAVGHFAKIKICSATEFDLIGDPV